MPNHYHLVLRPHSDGAMGRLMGWVSSTHTARYRAHHHSVGGGHLFQGPFKSFPLADDRHFLVVYRYVERNALSAGLVDRAAIEADRLKRPLTLFSLVVGVRRLPCRRYAKPSGKRAQAEKESGV